MHSSLEHIDACLPITALEALDVKDARFILQGQGPFCRLIDEGTGKLLAELRAFKRNNVHGFLILDRTVQGEGREHVQLVAWGEQSVRVVDLLYGSDPVTGDLETSVSAASAEFLAPDRILAGCASSVKDEEQRTYLVTAHNALVSLHVVNAESSSSYGKAIHLQQLATGVKSILYSAHTVWLSSSHVLIAAGTVFGEIIVWSCFIDRPESLSSNAVSSIHHFFTGHDGSIFGVEMSPTISYLNGNQPGRLLVSCSDDRTARIWDISDCEHASPHDPSAYSTDGFELRSTGFGAVRELGSESCVAKAYGHIARIWGVHFMPTIAADQGKIRLVSRGEDAQCLLWDLTWEQSSLQTLEFHLREVSSFHYHAGKHIFSLTMRSIEGRTVVYSGGNDGAIKTFVVDENEKQSGEISQKAPLGTRNTKAKKDVSLRAFDFVSPDCFIATSVNGEVQLGWVGLQNFVELDMQPLISKETLSVEDDLRGYSVISSLPQKGLALLGNSRGLIRSYNHQSKSLSKIAQADQRPLGLFALEALPSDTISFVTSYVAVDRADLFTVTMRGNSEPRVQTIQLCLAYPSEVQCASLICGGRYLALGFKSGALAAYRVPNAGDSVEEPLRPLTSIRSIHGNEGTRHIAPFSSQDHESGSLVEYILTCGRDGNYCVHEIATNAADDSFHLQTVHRSSPATGQNIEGIYFDKASDDLMLYGFRGMDFVLWNESTQSEVAKFFCGGARRVWAFHPSPEKAGDGVFLWHQSGFNCRRIHVDSSRPLRAGGHGREIKSMEVFNAKGNGSNTIFATGAEDTTVRVFAPIQPRAESLWGAFKSLRVLKNHKAGLQQVGWSKDGNYLFTSAGYEEFFVWRIRWIPRFGIATLLMGATPKEHPNSECRVTGFDTLEVRENGDRDGFLIVLTFPNSVIKIFHYSPFVDNGSFTLLAKGAYMSNCLTQARFVKKGSSLSLVTSSTDGHFTFWSLTPVLEPFYTITPSALSLKQTIETMSPTPTIISCESRYQIHSNSIKSLELVHISESASLVVAGGDDNALTLSLLNTDFRHSEATVGAHTVTIPDAHTASVTTAKLIEQHQSQISADGSTTVDLTVASSGNDHRVKIWSVSVDTAKNGPDAISVKNVMNHYSPVADISSLDVIQGDGDPGSELKLLVCGVGMEMLRVKRV